MNAPQRVPQPAPSTASTASTAIFARLLEQHTGQRLAADRIWRVETAVRPLLGALGIEHIDTLALRLAQAPDPALEERVVDVLLNQETSFFRDGAVLEGAIEALRHIETPRPRRRIWCAACATGQEPLSLAMVLGEQGDISAEILGTDVSAGAIARARSGAYSQFEVQRGLPIRRLIRWFDGEGNRWTASPQLTSAIVWRRQNLVTDPTPAGHFDLILCRNVLFYLAPEIRERVLEKLADALHPDGLLLLGAGETVIGQSAHLRPSTRVRGFYERVDRPPK